MFEIEETSKLEVNKIFICVRKVNENRMHQYWEEHCDVKTKWNGDNPTTIHEVIDDIKY